MHEALRPSVLGLRLYLVYEGLKYQCVRAEDICKAYAGLTIYAGRTG